MPVPPYHQVLLTSRSCAADFTSSGVPVGDYKSLAFEFVWTGFNGTSGVFTLQVSLDNTNFVDKSSATFTVDATGAGAQIISLNDTATESFYRVKFVANGNSAGSVTVLMVAKK